MPAVANSTSPLVKLAVVKECRQLHNNSIKVYLISGAQVLLARCYWAGNLDSKAGPTTNPLVYADVHPRW